MGYTTVITQGIIADRKNREGGLRGRGKNPYAYKTIMLNDNYKNKDTDIRKQIRKNKPKFLVPNSKKKICLISFLIIP